MKFIILLLIAILFSFGTKSQNLHTHLNAASITNESDSTDGWFGGATISTDNSDPQNGLFAIRVESTSNNSRDIRYTFIAIVGQTYNISIWAKRGIQNYRPAFANWSGLNGFSTTSINSTNWEEYSWTVTATSTSPTIRIYTSPKSGGETGDTIFIDAVSITLETLIDTESPTAATDLTSSNTTTTTTDLSWTSASDNVGVTNYEVFQDGTSIGSTGGVSALNVSGLTSSTIYSFTVLARDAAGNISLVSNTVNVTTLSGADTESPTAVTDLTSSNTTTSTTDLSWTSASDHVGVTNYEVFQDGTSIGSTGGVSTLNVSGLTSSTIYSFTVLARDAAGNISLVSNTVNVTTLSGADTESPTAATDLTSSNTTTTTTDLSWTSASDNVGVTNYEVFQDGTSIGSTGGVSALNVSGLTSSTIYSFTVLARDAAGNISLVSNTVNVTTLSGADTESPTAVTDLTSSNTTTSTTDLSWTSASDNVGVTNYEVFQDGTSIGSTGGVSALNVSGLTSSTIYSFTVFARDAAGNISLVSNTVNVTTLSGADTESPTAVTDLSSSNTTTSTTDLSWTSASDNVGVTNYEVFQDGTSIGSTGGVSALNVSGLTSSTIYSFTVFARDAAGNISLVSNIVNVTTLVGGAITDYTSENANLPTIDWNVRDLFANRNVGIGTTNTQGYRLAVAGGIVAEGVKVSLQTNWPDFVFDDDFYLPTIKEVEEYIVRNGHLINIPSAKEVEKTGINLGEMDAKLLQKIEELTLYIIEQQKNIDKLELDNEKIMLLQKKLILIEKRLKNIEE